MTELHESDNAYLESFGFAEGTIFDGGFTVLRWLDPDGRPQQGVYHLGEPLSLEITLGMMEIFKAKLINDFLTLEDDDDDDDDGDEDDNEDDPIPDPPPAPAGILPDWSNHPSMFGRDQQERLPFESLFAT
jgi:hypothetical protein